MQLKNNDPGKLKRLRHGLLLPHPPEALDEDDRVSEKSSCYKDLAKTLAQANDIILIGNGNGKSGAVAYLIDLLKSRGSGVSAGIKSVETANLSALAEPEAETIAHRRMIRNDAH